MIVSDEELWLISTRAAYKLAYGEHMARLHGKRVKGFDDRGLHPYSEQWGRITLAESGSDAAHLPFLSPSSLRRMAEQDAHHDFIREIREEKE